MVERGHGQEVESDDGDEMPVVFREAGGKTNTDKRSMISKRNSVAPIINVIPPQIQES